MSCLKGLAQHLVWHSSDFCDCITRDSVRNLFSIPFCVGFGKMNRAALSKAIASLSRSRKSWSSQTLRTCVTIALYSCRFLFQQEPSVALPVSDVHVGEDGILEFPARRKSDQSVLVATVLCENVFIFDHLGCSIREDR